MKQKNGWTKGLLAAMLLGAFLAAGCSVGTRPARFYTLNPMAAATGSQTAAANPPAIAVGPVLLPDAVRRPQIVSRVGANRLEVSEFHRWAGALENEVTGVVADNLALLLGTHRVAGYPWDAGFHPDLRVELDIRRLDGRLGEQADLQAVWTVRSGDKGQTVLASGRTVRSEPVAAGGYEPLVAAYSRLLEHLSREIAAAIAAKS